MIKQAVTFMAIGSLATICAKYYKENSRDVNKAMRQMMKNNEKTLRFLKGKM